jgi:mycothiol synthase
VSEARAPTSGDVPAVARLMSEQWPESVDEDAVRRAWSSPDFDPALDARMDATGYAAVQRLAEGRVWLDLRGRPSPGLVGWAVDRGRAKAPRIFSGSWVANEHVLGLIEARGFRVVRRSQRMEIDLEGPIPDPVWPAGTKVRTLRVGDERAFYDAHQETFADTWEPIMETYEEWTQAFLAAPSFDPDLWFLATGGDQTAGFAMCKIRPADPELGWIDVLGVLRRARRRGLGRALLLHAFHAFRHRGLRGAGLGVDADSPTGANRLYESVGMHISDRFVIYEKRLA